jgi:hypothetical protein
VNILLSCKSAERVPSKKLHAASGHRRVRSLARSVSQSSKTGSEKPVGDAAAVAFSAYQFRRGCCAGERDEEKTNKGECIKAARRRRIYYASERTPHTRITRRIFKIGQVSLISIPDAIIAPRSSIDIRRALKYY